MKTVVHLIFVTFLSILVPMTVTAQGFNAPKPGVSGRVQVGAAFLQTNNQLSTDSSNRRTNDLDGPADAYDNGLGFASVNLRYLFENGTAVYFGNPLEVGETFAVTAGVNRPVGTSRLDLSVNWLPVEERWKNPYQTDAARDETDVDAYGLKLKWQEIAGTPLEVDYSIDQVAIEHDDIGDLEDDLKRDGLTHELGVTYTLPIQPGLSFKPELTYTYADKAGLANSYHGIKIAGMLQRARPPWVLIGLVSGFFNQYEKRHPLFEKTREESGLSTFVQLMRLNLFGIERLFASIGGGYVWSDANIDFFDSRTLIGLAGVGIKF